MVIQHKDGGSGLASKSTRRRGVRSFVIHDLTPRQPREDDDMPVAFNKPSQATTLPVGYSAGSIRVDPQYVQISLDRGHR